MLQLLIDNTDFYDSEKNLFITVKPQILVLEHSLISISKWESKYKRPFFKNDKTMPEFIDYIRFMTINKNIDPIVYNCINGKNLNTINNYINDPYTATTINNHSTMRKRLGNDVITSEVVYYWMVSYQIPFECEKWHFNRLITLIKVCEAMNSSQKKMSSKSVMKQNSAINAARRKAHHTKG